MNHREKKRKLVITTLSVICIAVLSLTIAYAALSEMLTISGSGTVTSANWDISIANSKTYTNKKVGGATYTTPVVNGTTVTYTVDLTRPGDSVTLYFDVKNNGDINGELSSITTATPTCTSETGNAADASLVCDNLDISISYAYVSNMGQGDVINTDSVTCTKNSTTGFYKTILKVTVTLNESLTTTPSSKVTISNLKHDIIYTQTNKTCVTEEYCFTAGTKVKTENGYKNIEDIEVGEKVYAFNPNNNTYELKKVVNTYDSLASEIYKISVGDKIIEATKKHRIYVIDKGWVRAGELVVGDKLSSMHEIDTTIKNIDVERFKEKITVYNMEVEGHHNYLITENNFLVHNASPTD